MLKTSDNIFVLLLFCIGGVFMLVVSFVLIFIRYQNKLLMQQQKIRFAEAAHQQQLLQTVIESQEAERKRIGEDLHDDVGTALSNLRITIEMFDQHEPASFKTNCKIIIDKVIRDVRHISHNLSPIGIELYGFIGAVEEMCESVTLNGRLQTVVTNHAGDFPSMMNKTTCMSLYRVIEELLNNTIKHADATLVAINFERDEKGITIVYNDNGRGISPSSQRAKGMGFLNIESRLSIINAGYVIDSTEGNGFNIRIRLDTLTT